MISKTPVEAVLEGSDGRYYTNWQVTRRLRLGDWTRCLRQNDPDRRLVETADRRLLLLRPIDPAQLPDWAEIRVLGDTARIVVTRRRTHQQLLTRTRADRHWPDSRNAENG